MKGQLESGLEECVLDPPPVEHSALKPQTVVESGGRGCPAPFLSRVGVWGDGGVRGHGPETHFQPHQPSMWSVAHCASFLGARS